MRYVVLGKSGLRVSELALGAMTFGEDWGFGSAPDESRRVFDAFVAAGGNFVDTASNYTNGSSERLLGEFFGKDRDRFVLATKYTLTRDASDPNASGNHRKNLARSVEASLSRLRTEYLDLLWLHAWDFTTPAEEVMRALDDLVRSGKVLHLGVSDTPAWVVARCNTLADLRGLAGFVGLQVEYSLIERTAERELLPMARSLGLALMPWAAIGGGVLTGKYTRAPRPGDTRRADLNQRRLGERNLAIARAVDAVADEIGRSSTQVAINWVRQQPGRVIPILGARTAPQLHDALGCLEFQLSQSHLDRLDAASHIDPGFPHEFLARDRIRRLVFGDHEPEI